MLSGFGGGYKKSPIMKTTHKCQEMVYKNAGLEEASDFWDFVSSLFAPGFVPISDSMEKYLQNVMKATWLYGYDSQGAFVNSMPNGLGCFRLQCSGEIMWALFELRQLLPAIKLVLGKDDVGGLEGVSTYLKQLTVEELAKLEKNGCKAHFIHQKENQVLYVPVGWMATEHCVKGVLVYGLRKTVMHCSPVASENYNLLTCLFEASKKPVDKMRATVPFLTPAEPE